MNCPEAKNMLPDLLQDSLDAAESARLREHLQSCPACWQEWQELHETWSRLGLLPEEQPGPELRRGFYRMLEAERREAAAAGRRPWRERLRAWLPDLRRLQPAMQLAAAVLVVAVGFGAGIFIGRNDRAAAEKIERLSSEVGRLQQQTSLSLLSQPSATARLQGITLAAQNPEPGIELRRKLLVVLDGDPSVNVRLQAVDALYLYAGDPEVRAALSASLARQTSPQVQVALIDLLVAFREKQAASALKKLMADEKILPEVQQRARAGVDLIL